jgi:hypothetical protein
MSRLVLVVLAAVLALPAATAHAADPCPHRPGERQLARSAQAVVFERTVTDRRAYPRQTITGCSRRSGRRRVIDVLQRRTQDEPTKLVGLRLAGTRVAYVMVFAPPGYYRRTTIMADDAIHGGRRHDLGDRWPLDGATNGPLNHIGWWAVDAAGDVAWLSVPGTAAGSPTADPSLGLWRPGLGRRRIDDRADIRAPRLVNGTLRWQRDGKPRTLDLATIPPSACGGKAEAGTLDVDLYGDSSVTGACLRATGRFVAVPEANYASLIEANGPYLIFQWMIHSRSGAFLLDLVGERATALEPNGSDAVVDQHGSLAWVGWTDGTPALWLRDANGTRTVPGTGTGFLRRDGSTITWPGGGPTVRLDP